MMPPIRSVFTLTAVSRRLNDDQQTSTGGIDEVGLGAAVMTTV